MNAERPTLWPLGAFRVWHDDLAWNGLGCHQDSAPEWRSPARTLIGTNALALSYR